MTRRRLGSALLLAWLLVIVATNSMRRSFSVAFHALADDGGGGPPRASQQLPIIQFLFVMGIEGVGHHMVKELYMKSPSYYWLHQKWNLWDGETNSVESLVHALWDERHHAGALLSATSSSSSGEEVNGTALMEHVVMRMRNLQQAILTKASEANNNNTTIMPPYITIPLNVAHFETYKSMGMMSYPNFKSKVPGPQQYPDLHLLYQACSLSKITKCHHVLLWRNAEEVLESTSMKREFRSTLKQMKTMVTMNAVILSQLQQYSSQLMACWDFRQELFQTSEVVPRILGWTDMDTFREFYREFFTPPNATSSQMLPAEYQVFMDVVEASNQQTLDACHAILEQN